MPAEKFSPSELCKCGSTITPRPDRAHHLFRQQPFVPNVGRRQPARPVSRRRARRKRLLASQQMASDNGEVNRLAIQSFQKYTSASITPPAGSRPAARASGDRSPAQIQDRARVQVLLVPGPWRLDHHEGRVREAVRKQSASASRLRIARASRYVGLGCCMSDWKDIRRVVEAEQREQRLFP